jgi:pimeloyl-ACP methyl ester carboxylesterase
MLALAYAAVYPDRAGPLVLIGCGTFDPVARARMRATLAERTGDALQQRLERLSQECPDPGDQITKRQALTQALYTYAPVATPQDEGAGEPFDVRAHTETWEDMVRLQEAGVYPAAFAAITSPVLMLHGTYDPHPGPMIRASLARHLPQLEYREWERCGHQPWSELFVRDEFFAVLREWLSRQSVV